MAKRSPRHHFLCLSKPVNFWFTHRDEEREKPVAEPCAKSITSSDDSTRRRTSSSNDSVLSESAASGYSSPPLADVPWPPNSAGSGASAGRNSASSSPHRRAVADAPTHEVLETTVWVECILRFVLLVFSTFFFTCRVIVVFEKFLFF